VDHISLCVIIIPEPGLSRDEELVIPVPYQARDKLQRESISFSVIARNPEFIEGDEAISDILPY